MYTTNLIWDVYDRVRRHQFDPVVMLFLVIVSYKITIKTNSNARDKSNIAFQMKIAHFPMFTSNQGK